jgi:FkbM family methyltransferase
VKLTTVSQIALNRLRYGRGVAAPKRPTREQLGFFGQFVRDGSLVFDVGANVGDKAAVFLALGARVVAFEPQPVCVKMLHKRFRGSPNIEIVEEGLAERAGELTMSVCASAKTISTFSSDWKDGRFRDTFRWNEEIAVPVNTFDAAIQRFGTPDFTKIDVEGFEESVLSGLSQRVGALSFEFVKEFSDKTARCLSLATQLGYFDFNIALGEELEFIASGWMSASEVTAYIQGSDDELLQGDVYARA